MGKKIWYLDNLRLILALFVVTWHAANAYLGKGGWPVAEDDISPFVYGIKTILDAITMPLFFYISGYFVLPSIRKRGALSFLKSKTKTILLPWFLTLVLIIPFIEMIGKVAQDTFDTGYFELWTWQMMRMSDIYLGIITDGFYQRYMWFLSVLFAFFVLFILVYKAFQRWFDKETVDVLDKLFTTSSTLKLVLKISCITFFPMIGVMVAVMIFADAPVPEPFFSFFNIIQFQTTRLPIYIVYFILGVVSYKNRWFERGLLTHRTLWNTLFAVTGIIYFVLMNFLTTFLPEEVFGLLFIIVLNIFIISTLGFALSTAQRYLDSPLFGKNELSSHAFNIYILHYIYVFIFQFLFLHFGSLALFLKFIGVTGLGIVLSYLTSRFVLKPHPRLTVTLGCALTILLFFIVR